MNNNIRTLSGISGWRSRLKDIYSSFNEFLDYTEIYNLHIRLGYASPLDAWEDNPIVEGSVNPSDYRKIK